MSQWQRTFFLGCLFISSIISLWCIFILHKLYPQVNMTIHSQCKNPIHSWNGKIMNIPVWKNTLKGRPNDFSVGIDEDKKDKNYSKESRHHTTSTSQMFLSLFDDKFSQTGLLKMTLLSQQFIEYLHRLRNSLHSDQTTKQTATGRYLRESTSRNESVSADSKRPIIMWGTHHKTGTFFAIKVFSLLCARESWCCRFHVSRDSIKALQHSLTDEMPAILGHNQWVWYPEEIVSQHKSSAGPVVSLPYRFVHFYRDPLQKVLSGYRYHKDGIEGWSRRSKQFANLCNSSLVKASLGLSKKAHANEVRSRSQNTNTLHPSVQLPASTQMISEHCHASYLCQSCCRREHEHVGAERLGKDDGTVVGYISRPDSEYAFLCSHLGSVPTNSSLSDALATKPRDSGLLIEAALDFYENLRMARIVNHTWNDPNTLNVNIDKMSKDYDGTIRRILTHIDYPGYTTQREALLEELRFFDLRSSPVYRFSLSNVFGQHADPTSASDRRIQMEEIRRNTVLQEAYREIFELMPVGS